MDKIRICDLYGSVPPHLARFFEKYMYPWELLPQIGNIIEETVKKHFSDFRAVSDGVFVGKNVKIHESAVIIPPCIIGEGTEIRPSAFLRGNVIIGEGCVVGNSSEIKNSILMDTAQVPHYNYVGDSILGRRSHLGAGTVCSNLKADGKNVTVHGKADYETGLRKVGAFLGDGADVGCSCVLNPGTVVGKNTRVYPLNALRGVYPADSIVKTGDTCVRKI